MFTREDGPTALRADLLSGLSFSSRPEDIQVDGHSGSAVAGVSSVWNGSSGFVVVLIRFINPPHVERYMYSESLTDESMLALAQAEALRFAGAMGFRMDDPRFQELGEGARAKRLLKWNLIRRVRLPSALETPLAAAAAPAAVSAAPTAEASSDEEEILLESPIQTELALLELVEESVRAPELAELLEKVEGFFDESAHPTAPAPSDPPSEPEPPGSAAEEWLMAEPLRAGYWDSGSESEKGAVASEPLAIEPVKAPVELMQPAEAAGAAGEIPLESVVLEQVDPDNDDTPVSLEYVNVVVPATKEAVDPDNDDTPVSLEYVNVVVPAPKEAGIAPPVTEPNVFEFDESTDSEVVHAEPAAEDAPQQVHGEPMLDSSDEETIKAKI